MMELSTHLKEATPIDWDANTRSMRLIVQGKHVLIAKLSQKNLSFYVPTYRMTASSDGMFKSYVSIEEAQSERLCSVSTFGPWSTDSNTVFHQIIQTMERHKERFDSLKYILGLYACQNHLMEYLPNGISVMYSNHENHLHFKAYDEQRNAVEKNILVGNLVSKAIQRIHTPHPKGFTPYRRTTVVYVSHKSPLSAHDRMQCLDRKQLERTRERVQAAFPEIHDEK